MKFYLILISVLSLVEFTYAQPENKESTNMLDYEMVNLFVSKDYNPPLQEEFNFEKELANLDQKMIPMIEDVYGKKLKSYKIIKHKDSAGEAYAGPDYVSSAFPYAQEYPTSTEVQLNFENSVFKDVNFNIDELFIWNPISGKLIEASIVFSFVSPRDPKEEIRINARFDLLRNILYYQTADEDQVISCNEKDWQGKIWSRVDISKSPGQLSHLVTFNRGESMTQVEQNCHSVASDKIKCINQTSEILLEIHRPIAPLVEKILITRKYFKVDGELLDSEKTEILCQ